MEGYVVGGGRVVADRLECFPARTKGEVLPGVLLVGPGAAGEQTVRLEPQELCPGRPDATGGRAQAAAAEHCGDRSWPRRRCRA